MPKKSFIGVEIGNRRIKIAETKNEKLVKFVVADIPENAVQGGNILQWEVVSDIMKDTLTKNGFTGKRAAIAIPDEAVYMRRTQMPPMTAEQLDSNLTYEFQDFADSNNGTYLYDYSMISLVKDENGNVSGMDLLAVAAPQDLMESYVEMFKRAGLRAIVGTPKVLAVNNVFRTLYPELMERDYAVLDLGQEVSRIDIYSRGVYEVSKNIEIGYKDLIEALAGEKQCDFAAAEKMLRENTDNVQSLEICQELYNRIAINAMRALNYYTFEHHDNLMDMVYYYGGGSNIGPLVDEIKSAVELEFVPMSELANGIEGCDEALMSGPAAIGACWNA